MDEMILLPHFHFLAKSFDFSSFNVTTSEILKTPEILLELLANCTVIPDLNGTDVNCSDIEAEIGNVLKEG